MRPGCEQSSTVQEPGECVGVADAHLGDLGIDDLGKIGQVLDLVLCHLSSIAVDQAQGPSRGTARRSYGRPGVEADFWARFNERVVGKTFVPTGVFDDEDVFAGDRVLKERDVSLRLGGIGANVRREPLSVLVDKRDEHDRYQYCH